jgi:PAS domain S-box-containing protein
MGTNENREPFEAELLSLRARNAILEVAARHDDLLRRDAFEEFAAALSRFVPLGRLVVVVPDGNEQILYAASVGDSASPLPPFGARYPLPAEENRRIVMEGAVRICRDTRAGDELDRLVALSGYLSYATLPIRAPDGASEPAPIVAKLVVCFPHVDQSAQAPRELLEAAASLFGARFRRALAAARERRLAMILETSGDAMLAWDAEGRIADGNASASRWTGLSHSELMGLPIGELVKGVSDGTPRHAFRTQFRGRGPDGSVVGLPVSVTITRVQDDPVVAAHMLARDVSHVAAAEREAVEHLARVRALEEEHRTLLDNAPLVIFRLDPRTGDLRYLNRHAEVLLGISPEDARARPGCLRAAHADAAAARSFDDAFRRAQLGLPLEPYEARLVKPGGAEIAVRGSIYAITRDQQVVAVEGILADVSVEHAARTQLVQTDRLSTLGRLAAGVAHEINNPAAFLMLGLEHVVRVFSDERDLSPEQRADTLQLLGQLTDGLQRIATIVRDLRLFAGPVQARAGAAPAAADVSSSVRSALTLTRSQLVERARLTLDLAAVPAVRIEQGRLVQVLVNLLVNAAQAIPKQGPREHQIAIATRSAGDEVLIEVSDSGNGIAPADLGRIWTPFFTTKELGTGTGLGLAISRDIVERAGGRIEVISPAFEGPPGEGGGARFIVHLAQAPVASEAAAPPRAEPASIASRAPAPAPSESRRILIVEDDLALGRALAEELGAHHSVQLVHGGAQALQRLALERFDAIVCDLRMPEFSGESVYMGACVLQPSYASSFIFMTGLGSGPELHRLHELYRCPILEKPFPSERLLQAIARLPLR